MPDSAFELKTTAKSEGEKRDEKMDTEERVDKAPIVIAEEE